MAKIYTLALVSISEMRDSKIDSLFSDETETFSGKWEYVWQNNSNLSKIIDFKSKTYKTLGGAIRSIIGMTMQGSMIQVSVYSGVLVYLLSSVSFVIFSSKYRYDVKREYDSTFFDEKSRERDRKLNKILGF